LGQRNGRWNLGDTLWMIGGQTNRAKALRSMTRAFEINDELGAKDLEHQRQQLAARRTAYERGAYGRD
jgi:hypothetical protein